MSRQSDILVAGLTPAVAAVIDTLAAAILQNLGALPGQGLMVLASRAQPGGPGVPAPGRS